jgi:hypothetical protein
LPTLLDGDHLYDTTKAPVEWTLLGDESVEQE